MLSQIEIPQAPMFNKCPNITPNEAIMFVAIAHLMYKRGEVITRQDILDLVPILRFNDDAEFDECLGNLVKYGIVTNDNGYLETQNCYSFYFGGEPEEVSSDFPIRSHVEHRTGKPVPGYVYFILGGKYIKIGRAKNVDDRICQVSPILPFEISIYHTIKTNDYTKLESWFHKHFKEKRTNGEWFELDYKDLRFIKNFNEGQLQ